MGSPRKKVLFIAEAVTLAHVARPVVLASSLPPSYYDITLAVADRARPMLAGFPYPVRSIDSIPEQRFLAALARGAPLHDATTLKGYVEEDLRLLKELDPDVVVGDLRHSLAVSARITKTPYISIVNAYWSPYARQEYSIPDVPAVRLLGVAAANAIFRLVRPFAFASHCRPMNEVKRAYGFAGNERDLRKMYTDADQVVYPEIPELVPTEGKPGNHTYIGPILWNPPVDVPVWWPQIPRDLPIVYLTLGSSGSAALLARCLETLAREPVTLLVATVNAAAVSAPNVFAAKYLPGLLAGELADVVICNGGSPTAHQALAAGKPVLGIPANMDQHLNMSFIEKAGAGLSLRSDQASPKRIRDCLFQLLHQQNFRSAAEQLRMAFAAYKTGTTFLDVLGGVSR